MRIYTLFLSAIIGIVTVVMPSASAQVPQEIVYEGVLANPNGDALTSAHEFRFSLWNTSDWISTDILPDGSIEITSPSYAQWQEVHTVTPNERGEFSILLGTTQALPRFDASSQRFLQVEIKTAGTPDTAYELMDVNGNNGADTDDRSAIGSAPYAFRAENAEQSTQESFLLDADNTVQNSGSGQISLQFGNTLAKVLAYDLDNAYFIFNDNVRIEGNLTVTGTINGIDINTTSHSQNTDIGTTSPTFTIRMGGNELILDTSAQTASRTILFPDANTTLVGTDTAQSLTNKTLDADLNIITNIGYANRADEPKTISLIPEYPQMTIVEDGTNNTATLKQGYQDTENQYYYVLTSHESIPHDLDLHISIPIPDDFVGWQNTPLQIFLKTQTTNPSENQISLSAQDTTFAPITLSDAENLTSTISDTWEQKDITFTGTPIFTPGDSMTLIVKLQSHSGNRSQVGQIKLNYVGK